MSSYQNTGSDGTAQHGILTINISTIQWVTAATFRYSEMYIHTFSPSQPAPALEAAEDAASELLASQPEWQADDPISISGQAQDGEDPGTGQIVTGLSYAASTAETASTMPTLPMQPPDDTTPAPPPASQAETPQCQQENLPRPLSLHLPNPPERSASSNQDPLSPTPAYSCKWPQQL
jgi:hypothetical protein